MINKIKFILGTSKTGYAYSNYWSIIWNWTSSRSVKKASHCGWLFRSALELFTEPRKSIELRRHSKVSNIQLNGYQFFKLLLVIWWRRPSNQIQLEGAKSCLAQLHKFLAILLFLGFSFFFSLLDTYI